MRWVNKLDFESQAHKFCYMIFLSYDDDHLPALFFDDEMQNLVLNRDESVRIPLDYVFNSCKDEYGEFDDGSLAYLRDRLVHPLGLPLAYPKDITNFCKRFNKYCFKNVTHSYRNFRYFMCHEYGPSTYRPHIHGIIFFDDERIARSFGEILRSCWTFGFSNASQVFSNAGKSYVAQYVNMSCHLPTFYSLPEFRQKHQFSKFPAIGSLPVLAKDLQDIYDRLDTKRTVWRSESAKYVTLPIESSYKYRFFPKLQGYNRRSSDDRVRLYESVNFCASTTFEEFQASFRLCRWLAYRNIANSREQLYADFIEEVERDAEARLISGHSVVPVVDSVKNALYRLYAISHRVCDFASRLGCSVGYLCNRIDEYWQKVDYENLVSMYQKQEIYADPVSNHSVSDLVYMYPDFYRMLDYWLTPPSRIPPYIQLALQSFGIETLEDVPSKDEVSDFVNMSEQSAKIYKDTHKRHAVNAYRDGQLQDTDPELSKILRKYQLNL